MCVLCERIDKLSRMLFAASEENHDLKEELASAHYFLEEMSPETYAKFRDAEVVRENEKAAKTPEPKPKKLADEFPNLNLTNTTSHVISRDESDEVPKSGKVKFKDLDAPPHVKERMREVIRNKMESEGIYDLDINEEELDVHYEKL